MTPIPPMSDIFQIDFSSLQRVLDGFKKKMEKQDDLMIDVQKNVSKDNKKVKDKVKEVTDSIEQ